MLSNIQASAASGLTALRGTVGAPLVTVASPHRRAGGRRGYQTGAVDEIRQEAVYFGRFGRPVRRVTPGRLRRNCPALEHPAGKQGQGRLLHHLVQKNCQLPAKIGNVLQLGHFEVSQRSIGAFPQIVHGRSTELSHKVSPEEWTAALYAPRHSRYHSRTIVQVIFAIWEMNGRW